MSLMMLGLLLFIGLVVVHEFGHFVIARRNGVEVEEFGIGFPPVIWRKRVHSEKGDYDFTINLLPLGGFVRLKGENDADKSPGSFGAANLWVKIKIMLAGVTMNLFTAFVMLSLLAIVGMPKIVDDQFTIASDTKIAKSSVLISYVDPESPAEKAGIKSNDQLLSISSNNGELVIPIISSEKLPEVTAQFAGQSTSIELLRNGDIVRLDATLLTTKEVDDSKNSENQKGYLGIVPRDYIVRKSTWSAPIVAVGFIKQITQLTFKGLGTAISGVFQGDGQKASSQVAGPVGIFVILKDGSILGYQFVLLIIGIISLTLAIMNALPIPALDGGRLFVTLLFVALRKPFT